MPRRSAWAALALAALVAVALLGSSGGSDAEQLSTSPRSHVVLLEDSVEAPAALARSHADRYGMQLTHVYKHAIKGYSALVSASDAARLAEEPEVREVESDAPLVTLGTSDQVMNRAGLLDNSNFDIDDTDDYRVDADVAILDNGVPEALNANLVKRTDCANPDPWWESFEEYVPPDPEDPDWMPNERLNEAAEELPYGCLDNSGDKLPHQKVSHGAIMALRAVGYDRPGSGYGFAPGGRLWGARVTANNEAFGVYFDRADYPMTLSGTALGPISGANFSIQCEEAALASRPTPPNDPRTVAEIELDAEYGGCDMLDGEGEKLASASVQMNDCHYTIALENADPSPGYPATWGVACEEAEGEEAIEVKVTGFELSCLNLAPQEAPLGGVEVSNSGGEGAEGTIDLDAEVSGIEYELVGSYCTEEGTPETKSDGQFDGETTLSGTNPEEAQRGVRVVGEETLVVKWQPRFVLEIDYLSEIGTSHVIAGLDWVASHGSQIDVANMSIGCPDKAIPEVAAVRPDACPSAVIDEALQGVIDNGVVVTTAGGNSPRETGLATPASTPDVVAVSKVVDWDGEPGAKAEGKECFNNSEHPDDLRHEGSGYGLLIDVTVAQACGGTSGASARTAGAAASLASQCDPEDRAGVEFIVDTLMAEGETGSIAEGGWLDDSGDGWKEPLLNLSDEEVFDPVLLASPSNPEGEDEEADPEGCRWRSHQAESDVDGDGRSDLVTIGGSEEGASVYAGTYEGPVEEPRLNGFEVAAPTTSLAGQLDPALDDGEGSYATDVADVDGDRRADLIVGVGSEGTYVYPGKADGTFGEGVEVLSGSTLTFDGSEGQNEPVAVADVNGDGRADLVDLFGSAGTLLTFPGKEEGIGFGGAVSSGISIDSALLDGEGEYPLDVIDVTGEELDEPEAEEIDYNAKHSYADLVTIGTDGILRVYPGQGNGKFGQAVEAAEIDPIMDDGEGVEPVGLGDVDRDRRADLLVLDGESLKLYMGQADGTFVESTAAPYEAAEPFEGQIDSALMDGEGMELIGLLDYSRDGLADLVALTGEGEVLTYLAQRDKTFGPPTAQEGTIASIRDDEEGEELLAERPFLRRAGCGEEDCLWQPPLHLPALRSTSYPVTASASGLGLVSSPEFDFECETDEQSAELGGPVETLALTAQYAGCVQGGLTATVQMNSCRYAFALDQADPPYAAEFGVSCEEEGDAIETEVRFKGVYVCTSTIGPQQGLPGVDLTNAGEGSSRTVQMDIAVEGIEYELEGPNCGSGPGTYTDGELVAETTLTGADAEETQRPLFVNGGVG